MKNLRLLFCLLFVPQAALFAQTNFPFPDADAVWSVSVFNPFSPIRENYKYTVIGDTILNGNTYKKYYRCPDTILNTSQLILCALLREDTQTQRVYVAGSDAELLLYDFSLEVGDTVSSNNTWAGEALVTVSQITFDSEGRKQIHLNKSWGDIWWTTTEEIWIEGIGSNGDLFDPNPNTILLTDYPEAELLCFEQSGELIYQKYEGQCYYQNITGISKPTKQAFKVAINAANNQLFIGSPLSEQATLALYDVLGRLVLQQTLSPNSTTVGIEQLPAGVYLYQISYQKQTLQRGKVRVAR